ncbi:MULTISPECIES: DNA-processing protein DprA [unclassified Thioalkalivibrio]|uniref:DNA-processing protein DprA n=1 Tax=unclassified Thioalkalivibrio TaxID=2621013 RepID=UPI000476ED18|nr:MULTISPECIES: DNA-processing protein DprA [unclassified Thioalkalivibrio]
MEAETADFPAVSPWLEMGAYEALWLKDGVNTFKKVADLFRSNPGALPSELVSREEAERRANEVQQVLWRAGVRSFGVRVHQAGEYPQKLRDASHPVELLYYQGRWDLTELPSVAVVGARKPSDEGRARARKLAKKLVESRYTVVSGLAAGIDSEAHKAAIDAGGNTVAVIGTPLSHNYPKENKELQSQLARDFLVISQVPVLRYERQGPKQNRFFFPERNVTMSALTEATVIVEASDTSGTLTQARAALAQGRKLFILDSCFQNSQISWPSRFERKGAVRVRTFEDILDHLG